MRIPNALRATRGDSETGGTFGLYSFFLKVVHLQRELLQLPLRRVSCVLVNTDQGKRYLNEIRDGLVLLESTFEQVARHNAQLREPSPRSEIRETILTGYRDSGYPAVSAYFARHCGAERMKHRVSGLLPKGFKRWVKKRVGQLKTR